MQPAEAESRLQALEERWRDSPEFRASSSLFVEAMGAWTRGTRDAEEQERTRLVQERKKAESHRKSNLVGGEGKAIYYAGRAQSPLPLSGSDSDGDDTDITSEGDDDDMDNHDGPLRPLRPGESTQDGDEEMEYDSYDDDSYDSDGSDDSEDQEERDLRWAMLLTMAMRR